MFPNCANVNISLGHPLAENFDILKGHQLVKVPTVAPGSDYQLVCALFSLLSSPSKFE